VRAELLQPESGQRGMRRARDIAGQIVHALQQLEAAHFSERPREEAA
jgi:hypothetical protein